jgi:hypothetical protein
LEIGTAGALLLRMGEIAELSRLLGESRELAAIMAAS